MNAKISHDYFERLAQFFGSNEKAWDFLLQKNMKLGGISPLDALKTGKQRKVKKIIDELTKDK